MTLKCHNVYLFHKLISSYLTQLNIDPSAYEDIGLKKGSLQSFVLWRSCHKGELINRKANSLTLRNTYLNVKARNSGA